MEIKDMSMEELEARKLEILGAIEEATAEELATMNEELDQIEERVNALKDIAEKRAATIERVSSGAGTVVRDFKDNEEKTMDIKELRNSQEYIDAFADFVKTGKDTQVRTLLSTNATGGTIAVPDFVLDIVKTAWDKNEIMGLVQKAEIAGNYKVNFEISSSEAETHVEGSPEIDEEQLVEGIVTIIPQMRKKWISFSREVYALRGEAFLRYIYDELAYRIVKKIADDLISLIAALPAAATSTSPSANAITGAPEIGLVAEAVANLSDEATEPVVVMNKLTWGAFKKAEYEGNFPVDPFEGFAVHFNNSLPAYSAASEGDVYMIVGDFRQGALATYPDGEGVDFIFDEYTQKKKDLIEVLGQEFVGLGVVADKAFTLVKKAGE